MALAQLANLLGGDAAAYGGAYQNAQGQWVRDVTSNEGTTQQQSLQDQLTPAQWDQFQSQLSSGYLQSSQTGGTPVLNVNTAALPKVLGQFNVNPVAQNMGGGFTTLGSDSSTGPPLGGRGVNNPAGVRWDPNYGWVTAASNLKSDDDWFNKVGSTIGDISPTLIMAAMAAGFPAAIGAVGGGGAGLAGILSKVPGLINTATNLGQDQQQGITGDGAVSSLLGGTSAMIRLANLLGNG